MARAETWIYEVIGSHQDWCPNNTWSMFILTTFCTMFPAISYFYVSRKIYFKVMKYSEVT